MIIYKEYPTEITGEIIEIGDPFTIRIHKLENWDAEITEFVRPRELRTVTIKWAYILRGAGALAEFRPGRAHFWVSGQWPGWKEFRT